MDRRSALAALMAFAVSTIANLAGAETIIMNLDPFGTTSNQNIYGTVITGGSATWQGLYRDYQFDLQTSGGSTSFDGFGVQFSAQLRGNTVAYGNLLRATLWSGPIVTNPLLADSLVTVSTPNSSMTGSGFSSVLLSGSPFASQTITSAPSTFFFRIWAQGGNNDGYQTKMATGLTEFQQQITMAPSSAIDAYIEFDTNGDGTIDSGEEAATRDVIAEVVPEPSTLVIAASGAGLAAVACRRRRRPPPPGITPRA